MAVSVWITILITVLMLVAWGLYWKTSFFAKKYSTSLLLMFGAGMSYILLFVTTLATNSDFVSLIFGGFALVAGIIHLGLGVMKLSQVDSKYRWIHYHNRATVSYGRKDHNTFSLRTPDGETIKGVEISKQNNSRTSKAVIVCHGASRSKNTAPVAQTSLILAEQYDVFAFDFRGHMESSGVCYANGDEIDLDLATVVNYVREKGYTKVAVFGWSIGGAAALRTAAKGAQIDAVIAGAPAIKLADVSEVTSLNRFKLLGFPVLLMMSFLRNARIAVHPQTVDDITAFIPRLPRIPILLAYNDSDYVLKVNADVFEEFYERLPEPKDRIRLAGRGHLFDWPQTFHLWNKIIGWLESNL